MEEYVRGDVSTNTVEGYFSIFKRGMKGVYQHCGKKHPRRYAAEFAFRYSNRIANGTNDKVRSELALIAAKVKHLKYQGHRTCRVQLETVRRRACGRPGGRVTVAGATGGRFRSGATRLSYAERGSCAKKEPARTSGGSP